MKRISAILMALMMLMGSFALAEETTATGPLTLAEIETFNAAILARGVKDELTVRQLGDAFIAQGPGYELTLASEDLSGDTVVLGAAITLDAENDPSLMDTRATAVGLPVEELLGKYPNDNPFLAGSKDGAVLYISGQLPAAVYTGAVVRDGQSLSLVEYTIYHQVDGGVSRAGLQYTITDGKVRAMRSFMTGEALSQEEAQTAINNLAALQEENSVVTNAGDIGTPLAREDMAFGELDFFDLTPETAKAVLGEPQHEEKTDSGEGSLLVMQWPGVEAVFSLDKAGKVTRVERITVTDGPLGGPRGLRLGQSLAQAMSLFAHGADLPVEGGSLYGEGQTPPYGSMVVGGEYVSLYYVIEADGGSAGLVLTLIDSRLVSMSLTYL